MTTYSISNWTELISNTYGTGDIINITSDFVTGDNTTIIDLNDATLNGNGHTITFSGRTKGLFQSHGAYVDDLHLDGNGTAIIENEAFFLAYSSTVRDQYVTICNCTLTNGSMNDRCGGFISNSSTQNGTNMTNFDNCQVTNITLGSRYCGGFCAENAKNIYISNCTANVTMGSSTEAGGFIAHNSVGNNIIELSNATINIISGSACGGLVSRIGGGTTLIDRCSCTVTGGVTASYSAILAGGMSTSVANGTTLTIRDSYAVGDVSNYAGALVGYHAYNGTSEEPNTINLERCYHDGAINTNARSICGWYVDTNRPFTVTDCVVGSTDYNRGSGVMTLIRVDTSRESIDARLPDGTDVGQSSTNGFADNWSTDNWTPGASAGEYPILKASQTTNEVNNNNSTSIACLFPGTLIIVPGGVIAIEFLKVGDKVIRGNGKMGTVVKNIKIEREPRDRYVPILIKRDTFGKDKPFADTYISRHHKIWTGEEFLSYHQFEATNTIPEGMLLLSERYSNKIDKKIVYHHLILEDDRHTYIANGLTVESLSEINVLNL